MDSPAKRAIVIGMDGASMELVTHMLAGGHMPHLQRLWERGVHRPMLGVFPTMCISEGGSLNSQGCLNVKMRCLANPSSPFEIRVRR